jgi:chromosome segregation ATPase
MRVLVAAVFLFGAQGMLSNELRKQESAQNSAANSMIAKVIQMLGEEKDKISANIATETNTMAEYTQWCDDTMTEHSYAIKSANNKIIELNAVITDSTAQIASLDEDVAELGSEIAQRNKEIEDAEAIRAKDHEEFLKAETEQALMIEDLEQLETELKAMHESMKTTPPPVPEEGAEGEEVAGEEAAPAEAAPAEGAPAFIQLKKPSSAPAFIQFFHGLFPNHPSPERLEKLQRAMTMAVNSVWVDPESKKNLALLTRDGAFVQQPGAEPVTTHLAEAKEEENEQLAAFEGLRGKAEEALQRMRDEETKKIAEHNLNLQSLKAAIALAENNLDDTKREHARISQEKAEAVAELAETEASKAADEKTLKSVTAECTEASAAWDKRQSEAKSEMAAIEKAKGILAAGVTVLMQVKGGSKGHDIPQKTRAKLVNHFRELGGRLHSLAMLNLVSVVSSDPMEQVKGLLGSLIEKLVKEAKEAADLHEFCKAEKEKTSAAIKKKTMTISELDARLETAGTKKQQLSESVADLTGEIAEMEKSQAEATKLRNEERATYEKVAADYTQAAEAVDDAIDALKEYYGSVKLVQVSSNVKSKKAPPTLGGAKTDSAGGIISILETMGEEFRKSLKSAGAEERAAQNDFDAMIQDNKESKAAKSAEIAGSQSEIKSLSVAIHNFGGDKKMASKELGSVEEYVAKLKPQCGGKTTSYAERKAKMEAEITGLKEALAILEAEAPAGSFNFLQIRQQ